MNINFSPDLVGPNSNERESLSNGEHKSTVGTLGARETRALCRVPSGRLVRRLITLCPNHATQASARQGPPT